MKKEGCLLVLAALAALAARPGLRARQAGPGAAGTTVTVASPAGSGAGADADDAAGQSASDLAKKLQNPISDLISVPFHSNTSFDVGPNKGVQDILNIQPVIPIHLNQGWNVITRTILPLVWSPSFQPGPSVPLGAAPTTFSAFLSPKNAVNG